MQLTASDLRKVTNDGPAHKGDRGCSRILASVQHNLGRCCHLESETVEEILISLFSFNPAFQITYPFSCDCVCELPSVSISEQQELSLMLHMMYCFLGEIRRAAGLSVLHLFTRNCVHNGLCPASHCVSRADPS